VCLFLLVAECKTGEEKKKGKSRIVGRGKRLAIIKPVVKVGV